MILYLILSINSSFFRTVPNQRGTGLQIPHRNFPCNYFFKFITSLWHSLSLSHPSGAVRVSLQSVAYLLGLCSAYLPSHYARRPVFSRAVFTTELCRLRMTYLYHLRQRPALTKRWGYVKLLPDVLLLSRGPMESVQNAPPKQIYLYNVDGLFMFCR